MEGRYIRLEGKLYRAEREDIQYWKYIRHKGRWLEGKLYKNGRGMVYRQEGKVNKAES